MSALYVLSRLSLFLPFSASYHPLTEPAQKTQIGKTSGLVMTLTGILKNILLVIASVMIWQTSITPMQFLGYAIALAGLIYYSLGRDQIVEISTQLWTFLRNVWDNSPAYSSVSSSEEGNGQQPGGGLPSAVKRGLLMGLGVMIVVILAAGYIYGGAPDPSGGGGAVGVARPLGGGGDASSVKVAS